VDIPKCRNFLAGSCERSDPVILDDSGDHYQFGCRTCRCGWVVTKPIGIERARMENEVKRRNQMKFTESDKALFLSPQGGWR
jgi:hypothetical protein